MRLWSSYFSASFPLPFPINRHSLGELKNCNLIELKFETIMKRISLLSAYLILSVFTGSLLHAKNTRLLYIYDAGGLEELTADQQGKLVQESEFAGMVVEIESDADLENLELQLATGRPPYSTKTLAVTVRFDFVDLDKEVATYEKVIRAIAHQDIFLWVIVGNKNKDATMQDAEDALTKLLGSANQNGVKTAIYPHSYCLINSAEEALPLVKKLDNPDLSIVFQLCHEMRAGKTLRLREVLEIAAPYVSAMTLSGYDTEIDWATRRTMTYSTIKPLDRGNFDWKGFLADAEHAGIHVPIAFINFIMPY